MTLSIKQRALLITLGILGCAIAGSLAVAFIFANVSAAVIGDVVGAALIGWFVYLLYAITLNRLEYQETLKKLTSKD